MQCFWYVPTGQLWRVDYQRLEDQPDDAISNTTPQVTAMDGMPNGITSNCCMRASVYCTVRLLLGEQGPNYDAEHQVLVALAVYMTCHTPAACTR